MINWTDLEGSGRGLILRHYPVIRLEGPKKKTKDLGQYSRSPDRDLKPWPPEYEAGVSSVYLRTFL
jgi:hypothetical protein